MTNILIYILMNAYFSLSGLKDAVLWSRKGAESFKFNEHIIFVLERIVIFLILFISYSNVFLLDMVVVMTATILSFPFFHNGMYYQGRAWIDSAYNGFFDNPSQTSTAKINFTKTFRIILFTLSIIVLSVSFAFPQSKKQERLLKKLEKTGVQFDKEIDTIFIDRIKMVDKIVIKPIETKVFETVYKDTCDKSRFELRHDRKQVKQDVIYKKIESKELTDSLAKIIELERVRGKNKESELAKQIKIEQENSKQLKVEAVEARKIALSENGKWRFSDWFFSISCMVSCLILGVFLGKILR